MRERKSGVADLRMTFAKSAVILSEGEPTNSLSSRDSLEPQSKDQTHMAHT